jgi:O-antigen/teichoic acid export membrane protein
MNTADLGLRREASLTAIAKVVLAVFGFAGVVVFARVLGSDGVGTYYFGLALVMVLTRVSAGAGTAIKKRTSEAQSQPKELLWVGWIVHAGVAALSVAGLLAVSPWLGAIVGGPVAVMMLALAVATLGWFFINKNAYQGLGHASRGVWADATRMALTFGLQMVALWYGLGVVGLFASVALGAFVVSTGLFLVTDIGLSLTRRPAFADVLSFARWSVPNTVMESVHDRLDVMVLTVFVGSDAAGLYEAARRLTFPGLMVSKSLSEPLIIKVSGLSSSGRRSDVRAVTTAAVAYAGIAAIPILFGAIAVGEALLQTVYGPTFGAVSQVLVVLALFQVVHVYRFPFRAVTDGINRPETNFRVNAATVSVNVGLSLSLVGPFGILGVALATTLTETLRFVYYQYLAERALGGVFTPAEIGVQLTAALGMYLGLHGLERALGLGTPTPAMLGLLVGLGGILYTTGIGTLDERVRTLAVKTGRQLRTE